MLELNGDTAFATGCLRGVWKERPANEQTPYARPTTVSGQGRLDVCARASAISLRTLSASFPSGDTARNASAAFTAPG
jgi:hypothetical protein